MTTDPLPLQSRDKLYLIRKYVKASSAVDAIEKETAIPVHEIVIYEKWETGEARELAEAVGFQQIGESEDEDMLQ